MDLLPAWPFLEALRISYTCLTNDMFSEPMSPLACNENAHFFIPSRSKSRVVSVLLLLEYFEHVYFRLRSSITPLAASLRLINFHAVPECRSVLALRLAHSLRWASLMTNGNVPFIILSALHKQFSLTFAPFERNTPWAHNSPNFLQLSRSSFDSLTVAIPLSGSSRTLASSFYLPCFNLQ